MVALDLNGVAIYPGYLDAATQGAILREVRAVVAQAPLFAPVTRWGKEMSVRMTSAGRLGWVSDRRGYRYEPLHPRGTPWPPVPETVLTLWRELTGTAPEPDCCLINFYRAGARMGLHQDRDEGDFSFPVVSVSLGDDGLFRVGGTDRGHPTRSHWLRSGDVCVMGGPARLHFHGVDRIKPGTSQLLRDGGRVNLTLRVVRDAEG